MKLKPFKMYADPRMLAGKYWMSLTTPRSRLKAFSAPVLVVPLACLPVVLKKRRDPR